MTALALVITRAGLERFTAAQVGEDIDLTVSEVGLTDAKFVVAPTLETLPGEFRRVATISGDAVGDNIVHMIVRDDAPLGYTVRGFGLYLADGTLFAVYGQEAAIFEKSAVTTMLLPIDIAFPSGDVELIQFGDTNFLNPPATTATAGVAKIATPAQLAAGTDDRTIVTPSALRQFLPVGTVTLWWGAAGAIPAGWAICNGQQVQRSDGTGLIATPDLRDRVAVGAGGEHALGDAFGAATSTADTSLGGGHTHIGDVSEETTGVTLTAPTSSTFAGGGTGNGVNSATLQDPGHAHDLTIEPVEAHAHAVTVDTTQPSLALFFIMRI